ncbi:cell wall-binding repeat-containing protein [Proteinivorax tanatarense]|uniref:Cell wall-binding repeat-containing protein n=1 Tax=Proteinivorax tanatarense TaxID=1260629 RepID=A0AAU7VJF6_9FIRM
MLRKLLALSLSLLLLFSGSSMAMTRVELGDQDQMVDVIVQLEDKPILEYEMKLKSKGELSTNSVRLYEQNINSNRLSVLEKANSKGIELNPKHVYTHTISGFSSTISFSDVAQLEELEGVKAVFPDVEVEVPTLPEKSVPGIPVEPQTDESVEWTNAPYLWDLGDGVTGEDMVVAVIDTGIDWTHDAFGTEGKFGPEHKVLGGVNFTEDEDGNVDYEDWMDRQDHGTHVAGTVAGDPIQRGENKYQGVAPDANLYGIKTLGDDGRGLTSWTIAGIEWAVNPGGDLPRADVINLSLGNSISCPNFPTALAANQAAEAGVVVVASAGNDGHEFPTTGSPSTGDQVISVGSYGEIAGGSITLEDGTVYDSNINPSDGPAPDNEMYGIIDTRGKAGWTELDVEDKILIADWADFNAGNWAFPDIIYAAESGAEGLLVFEPGGISIGGEMPLPLFGVEKALALDILEKKEKNPGLKIALDLLDPEFLMSDFSSAGPTSSYTLKPDITAPGDGITAPLSGDNSYGAMSGTSMSAPHVAGGVALLRQLKPDLTVEETKALLMNTPWWLEDENDEKYAVTTQGSGIMDLQAAAKSRGVAVPGSLSLNVSGEDNTVTVKNTSDEEITYDIELISDSLEATFVDQITVDANSEAEFDVNFNLEDLKEGPHEGYLMLTPTEGIELEGEDEEYFDSLQVTAYYYEGIIEDFFTSDLRMDRKLSQTDSVDITFTLGMAAEFVEVNVLDREGNLVHNVSEAKNGLSAGTWTLHNTNLGELEDGEYILQVYAEWGIPNLPMPDAGDMDLVYETFEVNTEVPNINLESKSYSKDKDYTLNVSTDVDSEVLIDGKKAIELDKGVGLEVTLEKGENTFLIEATTPYGVTSSKEVTVVKIDKPIYSLEDLYETPYITSDSVYIKTEAESGAVVTYTVNGEKQQLIEVGSDGLALAAIEIEDGYNDIKIVVNADNEVKGHDLQIFKKYVERLAGDNRFETATEISKYGWEQSDTVILARADDFADSLAGVPLSKKLDAPILLTQTDTLSDNTLGEIERLGAGNVIILGGKNAVSDDIKDQLKQMSLDVERIGGEDRFETAKLISEKVVGDTEKVKQVVVAYGNNFPDGLSAAPLAANNNAPILLVDTEDAKEDTLEFIKDHNVESTLVIGGKAVISDEVMENLPNAERISGDDRYETSIAVAEKIETDTVFVSSGTSFADSLTAAALAAKKNGTVVLSREPSLPTVTSEYLDVNGEDFNRYYIAGGNAAINAEVEEALRGLLK